MCVRMKITKEIRFLIKSNFCCKLILTNRVKLDTKYTCNIRIIMGVRERWELELTHE